jgi:HlyD family secretion protein
MNKKKKIAIIAAAVVVLVGAILILKTCKKSDQQFSIETAKVTRSNISNTVTATGTIQAIKTVAVGTQVSGVVSKLYADFNSHVKRGQLLAEIDKAPLLSSLESSQAQLDNAQAELNYQTSNYNRIKALFDKKLVSQYEYDQALYTYSSAKASMKTAQTNYDKSKINLDYATIYSPIDGVVLNRAVDEGQTVAASFSTPTLFSIANDLTQMQVEANIDEADIGQVKVGQKVEFTVDAFSDIKFAGEVTEIRLQPTTTNNVVTYTVIVKAPNPDLKLMPGMTANIVIMVEEANNVLIASAKALRFKPDQNVMAAYLTSLSANEKEGQLPPQEGAPADSAKGQLPPAQFTDQDTVVWVINGKDIHPRKVKTGITDGVNIEIISGLEEGDELVLSLTTSMDVTKQASSPFMPKRPGSDKKK